ncbi:MAG: hypothetical protein KME60_14340 [Cyanomargarita calcarea GSE-NOS-MK-12-04C]|uniref:Uncharacterized protein n=1 Tax=Cyanomargarita calcarea GSE-NOS-MK-12-04C TaxID=2839659 RepID=A0A951QN69_9CYAN|nr:hypothetical protein [Cyanomargarita calcarea GSE-NOS-MK-12-04C]
MATRPTEAEGVSLTGRLRRERLWRTWRFNPLSIKINVTDYWSMSLILRRWLDVENLVERRNFASLHPSKLMTWSTSSR